MLPPLLAPQLCTLSPATRDGDGWLHEIKYDGWRLLARKDGNHVRLFTRGGHEWHARLPKLVRAIAALPVRRAWLDGELVYLDANGYPSFERLAGRVRTGDESRLFYQVWDMPWRNTRDLRRVPLLERKAQLAEVLANAGSRVRYTAHAIGGGNAFFDRVNALDLEGIVSKRVDSRYATGERSRDWLKVKCWRTHHVVVGGIDRDEDAHVIALLVGSPDGAGLRYEGRVEFGLHRVRDAWRRARPVRRSPFGDELRAGRRTWVAPRVVLEIRALPRPAGELLRHATAVRHAAG